MKDKNLKKQSEIKKRIENSLKQMRKQPDYENFTKLLKSLGKK